MKKKSCVWLVCLLLCMSAGVKGQVIRVDGGVAFSKLKAKGIPINSFYDGVVIPFQMSVGLEYGEGDWYNLSSSIGYLRKGGSMNVEITENIGDVSRRVKYQDYVDYLTVNTLFNVKRSIRRETYYVGVGPRLDFKMGASSTCSAFPEILQPSMKDARAVVFGMKCELGFWYDLNEHYRIGGNFSYLPSFTKTWVTPAVNSKLKIGDRTFTLGLSLGYRL